jgi:fucose 4-O-acetylase-like acetyltransferase
MASGNEGKQSLPVRALLFSRMIAQRTVAWIGLGAALIIGLTIVIAIVAVIGFLAIFTPWAPILLTVALWFASASLFARDRAPYEASRFGAALIVAWAVDAVLFRILTREAPHSYQQLVPGLIVFSVFAGYLAWRQMAQMTEQKDGTNPLLLFGSFSLAIFLMFNAVSPVMTHLFPGYWADVTRFTDEYYDQ